MSLDYVMTYTQEKYNAFYLTFLFKKINQVQPVYQHYELDIFKYFFGKYLKIWKSKKNVIKGKNHMTLLI